MPIIEMSHVIIRQYHIHRGLHIELIDITIDSNIAVDETSIVWPWDCTSKNIDKIFSHWFDYEIFDVTAKIALILRSS